MSVSMHCLRHGRMQPSGLPLPPKKSTGIKWALIAAVVILATAILAAAALCSIIMAGIAFSSGVGIFTGVLQLSSAVMTGLSAVWLGMIAHECIKNANHHLKGCCSARGHRLGRGVVIL